MNERANRHEAYERAVDACIHVLGVTAGLAGASALMIVAMINLPAWSTVSLGIYAAGLVSVFGFSAGYHLVRRPQLKAVLRRFDHAAIYVKIAGTYTPFAVVNMGGPSGYLLLTIVWSVALFGITSKLLWSGRLMRTSYILYVAQGWAVFAVLEPFSAAVSVRVLLLLMVGGGLYTIGFILYLWQELPYQNAIWHAFVLAASCCHFAAIVDSIVLA